MEHGNSGSGYMNTAFDGSNKSSGFTKKPFGEQTLRPLTVKQIKNCEIPQDDNYKVDNAIVTQLTIVGVIRNIQEMATNYIYTIEDGTGAIDVRKWVETNESPKDAEARRALLVDTYVRVNGRINSFSNRVTIVGHSIRPIVDFNEVTYHLLDTIHTHLTFVKPSQGSAMEIDNNTQNVGNSINDRVYDFIKQYDAESPGCKVEQIIYNFKNEYTEKQVRDVVEYLENEGQCYTTDNDNHIKSCFP